MLGGLSGDDRLTPPKAVFADPGFLLELPTFETRFRGQFQTPRQLGSGLLHLPGAPALENFLGGIAGPEVLSNQQNGEEQHRPRKKQAGGIERHHRSFRRLGGLDRFRR